MKMSLTIRLSVLALALLLSAPARAAQSIFLDVPGIVGEQATPGHPGVIRVQSYSLAAEEFTVVKVIDSTTDDFFQAAVSGTPFPAVSLLFYDTETPAGPPDSSLTFRNAFVSAHQIVQEFEHVTFAFQSVPEPSAALALIGCTGAAMLRVRSARTRR